MNLPSFNMSETFLCQTYFFPLVSRLLMLVKLMSSVVIAITAMLKE